MSVSPTSARLETGHPHPCTLRRSDHEHHHPTAGSGLRRQATAAGPRRVALAGPAHAGTDFILANAMNAENVQNVASRAFIAKLEELSGGEI